MAAAVIDDAGLDLPLNAEQRAFRDKVRAVLAAEMPPALAAKGRMLAECTREEVVGYWTLLAKHGWLAQSFPREEGGADWTVMQRVIFDIEANRAGAPRQTCFGVNLAGPAIIHFGTLEQKQRFLPKILDVSELWCQGYSEPGAGSDLAALSTRAVREGDHYVVNGSKIWTTLAHWADRVIAIVRTDAGVQKQKGITFLLIDLKSPGVTVRPIPRISGVHDFNQVLFDNVRVPVADRLGDEGQGWTIAKYVLNHERGTVGAGFGALARFQGMLRRIAREQQADGRRLIDDAVFRRRLSELEVQVRMIVGVGVRMLSGTDASTELGQGLAWLKLESSRIQYELAETMVDAVGWYACPHEMRALLNGWGNEEPVGPEYGIGLVPNYLDWRKIRIGGGGSDEVSHNIIAKRMLQL